MQKQTLLLCVMVSWCVLGCPAQATVTVDQEQNIYSGDISISAASGFEKVGQLFTAGLTGALNQIDMGFGGRIDGDGAVYIFEGQGDEGTLLESVTVKIQSQLSGAVNYNSFVVDVPIEKGEQYTFYFEPNPLTMPDPYSLCAAWPDPYTAGLMVSVENGDSVIYTYRDLVFRTWVNPIPEPGTVLLLGFGGLCLLRKPRR